MPTAASATVLIPPRGVDYRGKVVLAPMVRSGELPSRLLALHYGADLVWGPETVDRALIGTTRRTNPRTGMLEWTRAPSHNHNKPASSLAENVIYRLDPAREAGRLVFQLGTADPARAVAAARLVAGDVAGIDVNAGCPKPFSTSGGMGAALLQTPDRLVAILEALVAAELGIGISVKIRLLETREQTEVLVRRLVRTGITGLTVHCRTTPMRPREPAIRGQLAMVAGVCREAGVACVMNGDVAGRTQAQALMAEHGVDGAMIATAAEKNPSCFAAAGGKLAPWEEVVALYLRFAIEVENKWGNTKFMIQQMIPGKTPGFQELMACKSYAPLIGKLVEKLGLGEELLGRARAVDALMGLDQLESKAQEKKAPEKKRKMSGEEVSPTKKKMAKKTLGLSKTIPYDEHPINPKLIEEIGMAMQG
ncbi:hypothetical protein B0T25DRAFT_465162 [Lasiosphaeria hispida]|uniref:DUS-like FMN-binding domain-containing protein n=1 Tax=Lasiosphaeria hispida TaxID=260671 RepID=A0AAJ0H6N7_9PEZI|nr:hypothetical protein B0T25DRAFT_465162 [Lasiosphaeria hispida]